MHTKTFLVNNDKTTAWLLRSVDKNVLPVYWRFNKNAWVTKTIFEDWFENVLS